MSWLGSDFEAFFKKATGHCPYPYPYQKGLATSPIESRLISVPTGAGKTAAAILSWLYHRYSNPETTPRRLLYCLPMRVLVEQTRDRARRPAEQSDRYWPVRTGPCALQVQGTRVEASRMPSAAKRTFDEF